MSLIFRDAFEMRPVLAGILMVVISGALLSGHCHHYLSPVEPPFRMRTFVFLIRWREFILGGCS